MAHKGHTMSDSNLINPNNINNGLISNHSGIGHGQSENISTKSKLTNFNSNLNNAGILQSPQQPPITAPVQ